MGPGKESEGMTKKSFLGAAAVAIASIVAACLLVAVLAVGKSAEATTLADKNAARQVAAHTVPAGGGAWAWGRNYFGQLGNGTDTTRLTPVRVSGLSGVKDVAAGDEHSLAVKKGGTVWAWGANLTGQLGDGTAHLGTTTTPVKVKKLKGVVDVAGSRYHSLALKEDGSVWAWGFNQSGQLGDGTQTTRRTPVRASGLSGVKDVTAGWEHILAR
jgi:alpha-tubulin suppressor-like RCC1 family protein